MGSTQSTWGSLLRVAMKTICLFGLIALTSGAPRASNLGIVGGKDASYGEIPYQVSVLKDGVEGFHKCGGSLIDASWVLTAAHCCKGHEPATLGVSVGILRLLESDLEQQDIGVKSIVMHEDFDPVTWKNDICLLELETPATLSENVATIALPSSAEEHKAGTKCQVSGWGKIIQNGFQSNVLQKVSIPIVSEEECKDSYNNRELTDSMVCAGVEAGNLDTCQGDAGGPLACDGQLVGVVSWDFGCGRPGYYGIYTKTSSFVDWIKSKMN